MDEIGYFDIVDGGQGVSLIEWSVLIEGILPKERIEVTIRKNPEKGFDYREIEIVYPDGMQVPALPDQKDR
jgi:tRNA threonylcarbamoyladenosine biosynthesis protein TsaE